MGGFVEVALAGIAHLLQTQPSPFMTYWKHLRSVVEGQRHTQLVEVLRGSSTGGLTTLRCSFVVSSF